MLMPALHLALHLALLLAAPRPPAIDVAVHQLCDARALPFDFCLAFTNCGPVKKGTCSSSDEAQQPSGEDWSSWRCDVDVRNGYLTCTEQVHLRGGPGSGEVLTFTRDAALFISKGSVMVAAAVRGDRPKAWFFTRTDAGWSPVEPLPKLTAAVFGLAEPSAPGKERDHFQAEFLVELALPREGTTVTAYGRWVNTFRDDSGYGQSDTELSNASVELKWNAAASKFVVQRSP